MILQFYNGKFEIDTVETNYIVTMMDNFNMVYGKEIFSDPDVVLTETTTENLVNVRAKNGDERIVSPSSLKYVCDNRYDYVEFGNGTVLQVYSQNSPLATEFKVNLASSMFYLDDNFREGFVDVGTEVTVLGLVTHRKKTKQEKVTNPVTNASLVVAIPRENEDNVIDLISSDNLFASIPPKESSASDSSQEKINSTSDERTRNNVMRHEYRVLEDTEKENMKDVKDRGLEFHDFLNSLGESRELSLAKTKIEEAVMWATKHITR